MSLILLKYSLYLAAAFLLHFNDEAAGRELPEIDNECESHISIHGSSNVNQFQLINHNPRIVKRSDQGQEEERSQRIEIPVNEFQGDNKRMREDFLELVNASEYPLIIMTIEPRNLEECLKARGLSDFKTEITMAGVTQHYIVPCGVDTCERSGYVLRGSLEVELTDFGIDPPRKFFGLVKVNNEVLIDYVFRFETDDDIFQLPR
ncbi:MAG: YceI family protein [Bacteroidales bacterium]